MEFTLDNFFIRIELASNWLPAENIFLFPALQASRSKKRFSYGLQIRIGRWTW